MINYNFFCFVNSIRIFVEKGSNYSNSKYRLITCINREKNDNNIRILLSAISFVASFLNIIQ